MKKKTLLPKRDSVIDINFIYSIGGRPGGISPGGRAPSPDKRRSLEMRKSREDGMLGTMTQTMSDTGGSYSMTSDRINVDALLASQDYLATQTSDLASTADLRQFRSTDFSRKSGTFGQDSGKWIGWMLEENIRLMVAYVLIKMLISIHWKNFHNYIMLSAHILILNHLAGRPSTMR